MSKPSKSHEILEFEIAFYEQLVQRYPNFVDALTALGEAYTRRGWYEKGLAVDQQLAQLKASDAVTWYNLACSYSLLGRLDEALESLRRAVSLGYDDFEYLMKDPDLANVRRVPTFRQLIKLLVSSQAT